MLFISYIYYRRVRSPICQKVRIFEYVSNEKTFGLYAHRNHNAGPRSY